MSDKECKIELNPELDKILKEHSLEIIVQEVVKVFEKKIMELEARIKLLEESGFQIENNFRIDDSNTPATGYILRNIDLSYLSKPSTFTSSNYEITSNNLINYEKLIVSNGD